MRLQLQHRMRLQLQHRMRLKLQHRMRLKQQHRVRLILQTHRELSGRGSERRGVLAPGPGAARFLAFPQRAGVSSVHLVLHDLRAVELTDQRD